MFAQTIQIDRPPDWLLENKDGRIRCSSPDRQTFVAVEPVATKLTDPSAILRNRFASSSNLRIKGPDAEFLTQANQKTRAHLAIRGGAATLYLAAAPANQFDQQLPRLIQMLQSLRFATATTTATTTTSYQRHTEPREQSYSTEFPSGWRAELGLYRMGTFDNRTEASAVSPNSTIFIGDRGLGTYVTPSQFLSSLGYNEGRMYKENSMVLRYLPGAQAGLYWLNNRLRGARVITQRDRPDLAQQTAQQRYRYGNPMNAMLHAGEIEFDYQGQRGQATLITEVSSMAGVTNWSVVTIHGFFAKPGSEPEAKAALAHALDTWTINPRWLATERHFQQVDAENIIRTTREINAIHSRTIAERNASSDMRARVNGDLLSGTYRVVDPTTGETATVQAGSNYYYRVIDPNSPPTPVNLTRLLRIDWDTK